MSASATTWRVDCRLRASRWQLALGLLAHGLAALVVLLSYAPWWLKLACLPAIGALLWRSLPRYRLRAPDSVVALREHGDDWWLDSADGEGRIAVLQSNPWLWRQLLVLRFAELKSSGKPRRWSVAIFPDSLPGDDFRRLYVRLRWRRHHPAAAELDS